MTEKMNKEAFNLVKDSLSCKRSYAIPMERPEPTQEEIDHLFSKRITPETELPPMQPLFRMFDVPCFYRGELVADCGKAKSGKTFFLSILMAGALKNQMLALERLCEEPLKVLWMDTEQSQQSTQEILKDRIMPLAEVESLNEAQFYAFNLRGLGFEMRGKMVDVAIRTIKPDICIIDGVKDLMTDINDAVQATLIMEKLMALAKEQNCCIVCVLHLNKSEQDWNMRGSIGTELTNKAFEVFQCEMIGEPETFKVTHTYSRKQKMRRKFYYRVGDDGLPVACSDYREQPRDDHGRWMSTNTKPDEDVDLLRLFTNAMEGRTQRPFSELMAVALKKCGVIDAKAYYAYLDQAVEQEIIRKEVHPETGITWVELLDNSLPF
jgi:Txe/YoeB family toxin of Txe-Axe toxin-antitoxin module